MDLEDAVAMLMDHPKDFLERNALTIAGGSDLTSGVRIFTMEKQGLAEVSLNGPGWSGARKVELWRAQVTPDTSGRVLRRFTAGTAEKAEFRAYYVAMRQIEEDVTTTHYALPAAGGPDLMLTSQLSGCTFGYGSQSQGGACLVSHIQPAGAGGGRRAPGATSEIGKAALRFAVLGPMQGGTVLETSGQVKVTVIGSRTNGRWVFYKQVKDDATQKITVTNATI